MIEPRGGRGDQRDGDLVAIVDQRLNKTGTESSSPSALAAITPMLLTGSPGTAPRDRAAPRLPIGRPTHCCRDGFGPSTPCHRVQADARLVDGREGRRIHDLRHMAACLWLSLGVDVVTVHAWIGHASIATTNLHPPYLGTFADKAGLDRLNRRGHAGGTQREAESE